MSAPDWRLAVQEIKRLAVPGGRQALGRFTLEGIRSMERALRSDAPVEQVLISQTLAERTDSRSRALVADCDDKGVPVHVAPDDEIAALTGGRGLGDVFGILPIPEPPELSTWFDAGSQRQLIVVGTETADPGNTGAMIRTALASGAKGFVALGSCDPWHPKSVRTSMGSLFRLPVIRLETDDFLDQLAGLQVETLATVCRDAGDLAGFTPVSNRIALFMGSEAFGLPEELVSRLDRRITIEMPEGVDSYSVNAACAVLCYTLLTKK